MEYRLKTPPKPKFNNSAGRLLVLLSLLKAGQSYIDQVHTLYEDVPISGHNKSRSFVHFMSLLEDVYETFRSELELTDKIPVPTKELISSGLVNLPNLIFPGPSNNSVPGLTPAEASVLELAASLMNMEDELLETDEQEIRNSIERLHKAISASGVPDAARTALLEVVRLTRNALDQYRIYGIDGFRESFKRMLAELMDVYCREGADVRKTTWWSEGLKHVKLLDEIIARLSKYKPMIESATKYLSGSDGP